MDDEIQEYRLMRAIIRAFGGDKTKQQADTDDDDEPVIDTTAPGFTEQFQGFTGAPGAPQTRPRTAPPMRNTEIKFG